MVGERAELVLVVLEGVRVDGAELHTEALGVRSQGGEVVHQVPGGDVQRDGGGGEPGQLVHLRGIRDLLEGVARNARLREHLEAGAGVAERP